MGTLTQKTPQNEYLNGVWKEIDLNTGEIIQEEPFKYRNNEMDSETEIEPLTGYLAGKLSNMIYTSAPISPKRGDRFELEDQPNERKAMRVDPVRSKKTDLRLKNIKNKLLYLPKIITFE